MGFKDLLERTFNLGAGSADKTGLAGDPALRQGVWFDRMQHEITARVLPSLPLMDETTGPHLKSMRQGPLENLTEAFGSVGALNAKEHKTLEENQSELNRALSQLAAARQSYWKEAMRCQDQPGGCGGNSRLSELTSTINRLNNEILTQAQRVASAVTTLGATSHEVDGAMNANRTLLGEKLSHLQTRRAKLAQLGSREQTLAGDLKNIRLNLGRRYYEYVIWFLVAAALGVLSLRQLTKT